MKLIVGLGNPGRDYSNTRHNVGFMFVDGYLDYKNIQASWKNKFNGLLFKCNINGEDVIFLKPQTFMNLSGDSIRKVVDYYNISVSDILIISDDLDLYVGNFKLKLTGSSGGHNGLKNIALNLGSENYKRLRVGIGHGFTSGHQADYVINNFTDEELKKILSLSPILEDITKSLAEQNENIKTKIINDAIAKLKNKEE